MAAGKTRGAAAACGKDKLRKTVLHNTGVYMLDVLYHWPTVVTIAWMTFGRTGSSAGAAWCEALAFECVLRAARLIAIGAHEVAHLAAAKSLAPRWPQSAVFKLVRTDQESILYMMARQLVPGIFSPSVCVEIYEVHSSGVRAPPPPHAAFDGVVRSAGVVLSSLLVLVLFIAEVARGEVAAEISSAAGATLAGAASAAAGAFISDLPCGPLLGSWPPVGCFCCGNWGLLAPQEAMAQEHSSWQILPSICEQILSGVLEVVELRGAQAGGVNTLVSDGRGGVDALRSRTVKPKRGHLAKSLFKDFRWEIMKQSVLRLPRSPRALPVALLQGHSRFGTTSSPAVNETHPHQWLGRQREQVWRYDASGGGWRHEMATVCVTVTHNGDFDAFRMYGHLVSNSTLGLWLGRLLHHQNTAKGDSPKFAGLMDLMVCQGRWLASVRCAFVETCMQHITQVAGWEKLSAKAPNTAPGKTFYQDVAKEFDAAFCTRVAQDAQWIPDARGREELAGVVHWAIRGSLASASLRVLDEYDVSDEVLGIFCSEACRCFFEQDLLTALLTFFERAKGTFGVSASCTLWPSAVVLAAKGQPMSLAFDMERPIAIWSSEPGSLTVRCPTAKGGSQRRLATARWDLNDAAGEAVELRIFEGGTASGHIEAVGHGLPGGLPRSRFFATPDARAHMERRFHVLLRGSSLCSAQRPLTATAFAARWIRLRAPPFRGAKGAAGLERPSVDPVAADIQDIPAVLAEIDSSWSSLSSLNYASGLNFSARLQALLGGEHDDGIDVLVFGVENSLWVGQQFAADLKRIFPRLNVLAISSNWILGMLQQAQGNIEPRNFAIAPQKFRLVNGAIALALSHSGTTYPTVWAARLVTSVFPSAHGFAVSADFDTVLANSIGMDPTTSSFTGALFSTLAGVRPAEPATVATLAMHHTLTRLLVACARRVAKKSGPGWDLDRKREDGACELDADEVMDLERVASSLVPASEQICGANMYERTFTTQTRDDLLRIGAYVSSHLTEGWWSCFWMCFYIYLSVTFRIPIFTAVWSSVADMTGLGKGDAAYRFIDYAVAHVDAHFYVFLAVLLMLLHRLVHGRRLWTRFTARTLVVVDSTMNYKLLRAYGSKLGALAFPFTAFRVTGQNGEDHFVHEMTHLAQSDVILLVGRPDGRLGTLAAAEAATIMSTQQAKYICARPSRGLEAISIGHNPWAKDGLFRRQVVLPTAARPLFLSQQLLGTEAGAHGPGDVVAAAAAVGKGTGETLAIEFEPFAWVTKDTLRQELAKVNIPEDAIFRGDAFTVIDTIVRTHAAALNIDPDTLDVKRVCPVLFGATSARSLCSERSPSRQSTATSVLSAWSSRSIIEAVRTGLRSKRSVGDAKVSLSSILAVLRGRRMHDHIRELQLARKSETTKAQVQARDIMIDSLRGVRKCFTTWAMCTSEAWKRDERPTRTRSEGQKRLLDSEWRVLEEFRRRRWQHFKELKAVGMEGKVFHTWRALSQQEVMSEKSSLSEALRAYITPRKAYGVGAPTKPVFASSGAEGDMKDALPVGGRIAGQAAGGAEMLSGLRALERLYETRVAAAERLMASYVVLHSAVRPVSRLRFLRYDIDRSESRLRVASTPAPVPFVEELSGCSASVSAGRLKRGMSAFLQGGSLLSGRPSVGDRANHVGVEDPAHLNMCSV